jgi:hypothetical protein
MVIKYGQCLKVVIALKRLVIAALLLGGLAPVECESGLSRILIDTGHGGYPLLGDTLHDFKQLAAEKGFIVDFKELDSVDPHVYGLVLLLNPERTFEPESIQKVKEYLRQGGTVFLAGSGDYDNRDHSEVTNPLLEKIGSSMRFNDDQITDERNTGKPYIPLVEGWVPHPMSGSLPPVSVYSPQSVSPGRGYPLLRGNSTTRTSDTDGEGALEDRGENVVFMAVERLGKGDLFVAGSWDILTGFRFPGHYEVAENLLQFSQSKLTLSSYEAFFQGSTISTGERCRPEVDERGAEILSSLLVGPQIDTVSVIIGGPQVNPECKKINPFLPIQFERNGANSWCFTRNGEKFTGENCGILAVITVHGQKTLVLAGLGGTGTMGAVNLLMTLEQYDITPWYNAYGEAVLLTVKGDSNNNGVQEPSEQWEISFL